MALTTKEDLIRIAAQHREQRLNMTADERAEYDKSEALAKAELLEFVKRQAKEWEKQQAAFMKSFDQMFRDWNLAGVRLFEEKVLLQVEKGDLALFYELYDVVEEKKLEPPQWLLKAAYRSIGHRTATKKRGRPPISHFDLFRTALLYRTLRIEHQRLSTDSIKEVLVTTLEIDIDGLEKRLEKAEMLAKLSLPDALSEQDITALSILLDVRLSASQEADLAKRADRKRALKRPK